MDPPPPNVGQTPDFELLEKIKTGRVSYRRRQYLETNASRPGCRAPDCMLKAMLSSEYCQVHFQDGDSEEPSDSDATPKVRHRVQRSRSTFQLPQEGLLESVSAVQSRSRRHTVVLPKAPGRNKNKEKLVKGQRGGNRVGKKKSNAKRVTVLNCIEQCLRSFLDELECPLPTTLVEYLQHLGHETLAKYGPQSESQALANPKSSVPVTVKQVQAEFQKFLQLLQLNCRECLEKDVQESVQSGSSYVGVDAPEAEVSRLTGKGAEQVAKGAFAHFQNLILQRQNRTPELYERLEPWVVFKPKSQQFQGQLPPIVDIQVITDRKKNVVPPSGYELVFKHGRPWNFNKASTPMFISYKRQTEKQEEPVSGVCVLVNGNDARHELNVPFGFTCIQKTPDGKSANLNADTSGPAVYLCQRWSTDYPPILELGASESVDSGDMLRLECTPAFAEADLNLRSGQPPTYLCFNVDINKPLNCYWSFAKSLREKGGRQDEEFLIQEGCAYTLATLNASFYSKDIDTFELGLLCFKHIPIDKPDPELLDAFVFGICSALLSHIGLYQGEDNYKRLLWHLLCTARDLFWALSKPTILFLVHTCFLFPTLPSLDDFVADVWILVEHKKKQREDEEKQRKFSVEQHCRDIVLTTVTRALCVMNLDHLMFQFNNNDPTSQKGKNALLDTVALVVEMEAPREFTASGVGEGIGLKDFQKVCDTANKEWTTRTVTLQESTEKLFSPLGVLAGGLENVEVPSFDHRTMLVNKQSRQAFMASEDTLDQSPAVESQDYTSFSALQADTAEDGKMSSLESNKTFASSLLTSTFSNQGSEEEEDEDEAAETPGSLWPGSSKSSVASALALNRIASHSRARSSLLVGKSSRLGGAQARKIAPALGSSLQQTSYMSAVSSLYICLFSCCQVLLQKDRPAVDIETGLDLNERTQEKVYAIKALYNFSLKSSLTNFTSASLLYTRFFFPVILQQLISPQAKLFEGATELFCVMWSQKDNLKGCCGVVLQLFCKLLGADWFPPDRKVWLLKILEDCVGSQPHSLLETFYNYDLCPDQPNLVVAITNALATLCISTTVEENVCSLTDDKPWAYQLRNRSTILLEKFLCMLMMVVKQESDKRRSSSKTSKRSPPSLLQDTLFLRRIEDAVIRSAKGQLKKIIPALHELYSSIFIPKETIIRIATFLFRNSRFLDATELGDFLGSLDDKNLTEDQFNLIREVYAEQFVFTGLSFDEGIRMWLCDAGFRLPGESQKIDRLLSAFCIVFHRQNPGVFTTHDTAEILAFSMIMLNTDVHDVRLKQGKSTRQPMTLTDFIRNFRDTQVETDCDKEFLVKMFNSIVGESIEWEEKKTEPEPEEESVDAKESETEAKRAKAPLLFVRKAQNELRRVNCDGTAQNVWESTSSVVSLPGLVLSACWKAFAAAFTTALKSVDRCFITICHAATSHAMALGKLIGLDAAYDNFYNLDKDLKERVSLLEIKDLVLEKKDICKERKIKMGMLQSKTVSRAVLGYELVDFLVNRGTASSKKAALNIWAPSLLSCGLVCVSPEIQSFSDTAAYYFEEKLLVNGFTESPGRDSTLEQDNIFRLDTSLGDSKLPPVFSRSKAGPLSGERSLLTS